MYLHVVVGYTNNTGMLGFHQSLLEFLTVIFKLKNTEKSKGLKKEETLNSWMWYHWMLHHPRGKQNKTKIENSDKYKDIKSKDYTNVHFSDHQYRGI